LYFSPHEGPDAPPDGGRQPGDGALEWVFGIGVAA
jgi:hypothetical protein